MEATSPSVSATLAATRRVVVLPNAVLGTLFFVVAEVMFFSGAISAFTISRAGALPGTWPMPGQPVLPAEATALNTGLLLLSGLVLLTANWLYRRQSALTSWVTFSAWALGAGFLALQGVEWASLVREGLSLKSSPLGSFFYLIVGGHAVHAVAALVALGWVWLQMVRGRLTSELFFGVQTFWYFVVLLWPVIYARVYF